MTYLVPIQPMANTNTKSADQKHCYSCGVVIHISAQSCPGCGAVQPVLSGTQYQSPVPVRNDNALVELPHNHVFCRGCGKPIHSQASACPKCGAPQRAGLSVPFSAAGKDRIGAALLAFFLGGIGGHKFYLGQVGMGIIYLVFCWTFIPAIIAVIEGVIYLSQSDVEFRQKYG